MGNNMEIMTIEGVECYELDGTVYLKLETVARGLGFTRIAASGNEVVRWERVEQYLADLAVPTCGHDGYIPENIFYRLAMKAKNEVAEVFQGKVADEIIPSIRKHGAYMTEDTIKKVLTTPDFIIQLATELKEEQERNKALTAENQIMKPKAEYFDCLVDRNLLTNFRDTAKELHVKQNEFIAYLLESSYVYRDKKAKLLPYAQYVTEGLFELKEYSNKQTGQCGNQTLITPKGRETFRLLMAAKRRMENYA